MGPRKHTQLPLGAWGHPRAHEPFFSARMGCSISKARASRAEQQTSKPKERRRSIVAAGTTHAAEKVDHAASTSNLIGYFSNHGWEQKPGKKDVKPKVNQDRIFITPNLCGDENCWLFGVYDGNGPMGEKVAQAAGDQLVKLLEGAGKTSGVRFTDEGADAQALLSSGFISTNSSINKEEYARASGTTATVVYIKGGDVIVANVGDSRAVRATGPLDGSWEAQIMTTEHNPTSESEKQRILEMGGHVLEDSNFGAARVFDDPNPIAQMEAVRAWEASHSSHIYAKPQRFMPNDTYDTSDLMEGMRDYRDGDMSGLGDERGESLPPSEPWPGLAVSRVLGHSGVDAIGIVPDPDFAKFAISQNDRCLIIASDGVWDFVDEQEACDIVREYHPDAETACRSLVETASQRWIEDDPKYRDDISAVVVFLPLNKMAGLTREDTRISYTNDSSTVTKSNTPAKEPVEIAVSVASSAPVVAASNGEEQPLSLSTILTSMSNIFSGREMDAAGSEREKADITGESAVTTTPPPRAVPSQALVQASRAQKSGGVKATKEQRRRSVVTRFG